MDTLTLDLLPSEPHALDFAPDLRVRSFLLERADGNLLIYAGGTPPDRLVERQYLNHWHEAWAATVSPGARLLVHEADAEQTQKHADVWHTFSRRHRLGDDFEVIPIPGHTPGSTAYLWEHGDHRYLFTGDTLYLSGGEWRAAVLDSSDREAYVDALELIAALDFDVLVPWAASAGDQPYALTDANDTRRRIDAILARVGAGEDH
jgi:hypothetical protein